MRIKDAARLFSSGYLKALAQGDREFLYNVYTGLELEQSSIKTVRDLYESVYQQLSRSYRYEYFYKNTIVNKQLLGRHSPRTTVMLSEFRVGRNIADCVMLNGVSTCYEIKTEYDSLDRLSEQLNSYSSLFDKVYVVCDKKHLAKVLDVTPIEVGVILLTHKSTLSTKRKATDLSQQSVDKDLLIKSLRMEEYKRLVELIQGDVPKVSNIKMFSECSKIISETPSSILRKSFRTVLKHFRRNDADFLNSLPNSLKNAGVSYSLSNKMQIRLVDALDDNLCKDIECTTQFSGENSLSL
ncbi:TPA: hypothetical protein I7778_20065 [Vibrio vulnificus]|nr:hypothetical protein [Vibrio vulnificus]